MLRSRGLIQGVRIFTPEEEIPRNHGRAIDETQGFRAGNLLLPPLDSLEIQLRAWGKFNFLPDVIGILAGDGSPFDAKQVVLRLKEHSGLRPREVRDFRLRTLAPAQLNSGIPDHPKFRTWIRPTVLQKHLECIAGTGDLLRVSAFLGLQHAKQAKPEWPQRPSNRDRLVPEDQNFSLSEDLRLAGELSRIRRSRGGLFGLCMSR
jgi:hypothetical protein